MAVVLRLRQRHPDADCRRTQYLAPAASLIFRHKAEVTAPAFYSVMLDTYRTRVALTGTIRSGMMRIAFPVGQHIR